MSILTNNGKVFTLGGKALNMLSPKTYTLAPQSNWYKGSADKSTITEVALVDNYTPTGNETESWDASEDGSITAYLNDTKITISSNGNGKIYANQDSTSCFNGFSGMTTFSGAELLDASKVVDMSNMFYGCSALISLDLSNFDTSNVTTMARMFFRCWAHTIYVSDLWSTAKVTVGDDMFYYSSSKLVGAVPYDSTKIGVDMANYTTGYLTYKEHN